jgi:hypothetical protein
MKQPPGKMSTAEPRGAASPPADVIASIEEKLTCIADALDSMPETNRRLSETVQRLSADLHDLNENLLIVKGQVAEMTAKFAQMMDKLGHVGDEITKVDGKVLNMGDGIGKIEKALNIDKVDHCPQCGSGVEYTETNDGEMGDCVVCDWTHFIGQGG